MGTKRQVPQVILTLFIKFRWTFIQQSISFPFVAELCVACTTIRPRLTGHSGYTAWPPVHETYTQTWSGNLKSRTYNYPLPRYIGPITLIFFDHFFAQSPPLSCMEMCTRYTKDASFWSTNGVMENIVTAVILSQSLVTNFKAFFCMRNDGVSFKVRFTGLQSFIYKKKM